MIPDTQPVNWEYHIAFHHYWLFKSDCKKTIANIRKWNTFERYLYTIVANYPVKIITDLLAYYSK